MKKRSSGILMHISSLPGPYGIGDFGKGAYDFVDFLDRAKQKEWQILPLGITGYGDSPYQNFSAFAGNPGPELRSFYEKEKNWLRDYALFMALKAEHKGISWLKWPDEYKDIRSEKVLEFEKNHEKEMFFHVFI